MPNSKSYLYTGMKTVCYAISGMHTPGCTKIILGSVSTYLTL